MRKITRHLNEDVRDRVGALANTEVFLPGLYAVGDIVSDLHQIAVATGHAAIAATHI